MSAAAPWRILIVTEGPSDRPRLGHLLDYLILRHGDVTDLALFRRFEEFEGQSFLPIKRIPALARDLGLDRRYSSSGPKRGDSGTLRKLFQVLQARKVLGPDLIVVWGRDDDGTRERQDEAMSMRTTHRGPGTLLLAIASECGEAWLVAGWKPTTNDETTKLQELRQELGFDPVASPVRLSHKQVAPKSAKRVVETLFAADTERELGSLIAAIDVAASVPTGLRAFCDQVEAWLSAGPR